MQDDIILFDGDKLDISINDKKIYKTMVREAINSKLFVVVTPTLGGMPLLIHEGEAVNVAAYRERGKYEFLARARSVLKDGDLRLVLLERISLMSKKQRREYYRLPVRLKVLVCGYEESVEEDLPSHIDDAQVIALENIETKDISVTGLSIETKRKYNVGEKFLLSIHLGQDSKRVRPFYICAEVVRTEKLPYSGMDMVGFRFYYQSQDMSSRLTKFVISEQQKLIMKRRLIEDE